MLTDENVTCWTFINDMQSFQISQFIYFYSLTIIITHRAHLISQEEIVNLYTEKMHFLCKTAASG